METCCSSSLWLFDNSNGGHLNTTPKGSQGRSWVSALFKQNVCVCVWVFMLNKKSSLILCTGSYRLTCHLFCFFPSQLESSHCGSLDVHQLYIPLTNQENFPVAFLQKKIKMVYIFKFPMFSHVARFGPCASLGPTWWEMSRAPSQAALYPMVDLLGTVKRVSLLPVASPPAISEVSNDQGFR